MIWKAVLRESGSMVELECGHWCIAYHKVEGAEEKGFCRSQGAVVYLPCRHCRDSENPAEDQSIRS